MALPLPSILTVCWPSGRWRVLLFVLVALAAGSRSAAAQCYIAPSHGAFCNYKDPALYKDLIATAKVEAARWAGLKLHEMELGKLDRLVKRGADLIVSYDTLLKAIKTPRVPVPATFAAVFNVQHPDATVRLGVLGGTVVEVDVAARAAAAIRQGAVAGGPDALVRRARALGQLANDLSMYGQSRNIAGQVEKVYAELDSASMRGDSLARRSTAAAGRVRGKWVGLDGESDAQKIETKVRLDGLRATQELMHANNLQRTITALQRAQAARSVRSRALQAYGTYRNPGW